MIKFIKAKLCECGRKVMVKLNSDGSFFVSKYFTDKELCGNCFTFGVEESQKQLVLLNNQITELEGGEL